ncbi:hypothetical protein M569_04132, partial [Genlisea aurea]
DIETGQLYPGQGMYENPQLRWGFIRKVYSILSMQLLLTVAVGLVMILFDPVRQFMQTTTGLYVMIAAMVLTVMLCFMMSCFSQRHPWNIILLILFTLALSWMVGATCTQRKGQAVLMAATLTLLVTFSLTLFTFLAAKRGYDFNFLGPFLLCAVLLLMAFGIIRIIFPMGRAAEQVIACIGALVFCGFIIYDTDNIIKRYTYDQAIEAAACLYLDIINLFLNLLALLSDSE